MSTGARLIVNAANTGTKASCPDAAALDDLNDIELVVRAGLTDWTPAAEQALMSRTTGADSHRAWVFSILSTGRPQFVWYPSGTLASAITKQANADVTLTDGTRYWLKVTIDVDNGAAGNNVAFYYAADAETEPGAWTQIGTTVTTAGTTSLPNVTSPLYVGTAGPSGSPAGGVIHEALFRNGIGGALIAHFRADDVNPITMSGTAPTAEVWTVANCDLYDPTRDRSLAGVLNALASTSGLGAAAAANSWASTSGKDLAGALNAKAGTTGLGEAAAARAYVTSVLGATCPLFDTVGALRLLLA